MIRLEHIKKEYENVTPLKDINCVINDGDVVSLIGTSGTGKSTFLRMINMLERPTDGKIFYNDMEVTGEKTDLREVRKHIGMVFQSFNLFNHKTVIENLMMAPYDIKKIEKKKLYNDAMAMLEKVGLSNKVFSYPNELSGGQKQRAAIARTLMMNPDVVLFDEPTSALDPIMVGEVEKVIKDLSKSGLTMLIVTHEMRFAESISDRVFFLDEGIVYEEGTPEQIFRKPQKKKTQEFISKLKCVEFEIENDFDAATEVVNKFAATQGIPRRTVNTVLLILEEVCLENIYRICGINTEINIKLEYIHDEDSVMITIKFNGKLKSFMSEIDELSKKVIKNMVKSIKYDSIDEKKYNAMLKIKV